MTDEGYVGGRASAGDRPVVIPARATRKACGRCHVTRRCVPWVG